MTGNDPDPDENEELDSTFTVAGNRTMIPNTRKRNPLVTFNTTLGINNPMTSTQLEDSRLLNESIEGVLYPYGMLIRTCAKSTLSSREIWSL